MGVDNGPSSALGEIVSVKFWVNLCLEFSLDEITDGVDWIVSFQITESASITGSLEVPTQAVRSRDKISIEKATIMNLDNGPHGPNHMVNSERQHRGFVSLISFTNL